MGECDGMLHGCPGPLDITKSPAFAAFNFVQVWTGAFGGVYFLWMTKLVWVQSFESQEPVISTFHGCLLSFYPAVLQNAKCSPEQAWLCPEDSLSSCSWRWIIPSEIYSCTRSSFPLPVSFLYPGVLQQHQVGRQMGVREIWVAEHAVPVPDWAAAWLPWMGQVRVHWQRWHPALGQSPASLGCWSWDVWDELLKGFGRVESRQVKGKPCQGHLAAVGCDFRVLLRAVGSAASLWVPARCRWAGHLIAPPCSSEA